MGAEEHPADQGQRVDHRPQVGPELGERTDDVRGVRGQPLDHRGVRAAAIRVKPSASSRSKTAAIPSGLIEPKAAVTAAGPAGASGAHRAAM